MKKSTLVTGTAIILAASPINNVLADENVDATELAPANSSTHEINGLTTSQVETIGEAQKNLENINEKYNDVTKENEQYKETISETRVQLSQVESELKNTDSSIQNKSDEIESTDKSIKEKDELLNSILSNEQDAAKELANQQQKSTNITSELLKAQTSVDLANQSVSTTKILIEQENAENISLSEQLKDKTTENNTNNIKLSGIESAISTTKNEKDIQSSKLDELKNELIKKSSEIDNSIKTLNDKVEKSSDEPIIKFENKTVLSIDGLGETKRLRSEAEAKPNEARSKRVLEKEEMIYDGNQTKTINLTDEQQKEYNETGKFSYIPNENNIINYLVKYINELRKINGITDETYTSEDAMVLAKVRANEIYNKQKLSHSSESNVKRGWEVLAVRRFQNDSSENLYLVLSDEQYAYATLANHFSEYTNLLSGNSAYGHRAHLLFGLNAIGIGLSNSKSVSANYTEYYEAIDSERSNKNTSEDAKFVTYEISDKGQKIMYLRGNRIKFLPDITFNYTSNKKIVLDYTEKSLAKDALVKYQSNSNNELNDLKSKINEITNNLINTSNKLKELEVELSTSKALKVNIENDISSITFKYENSNNILISLNKQLENNNLTVETAKAHLNKLKNQNKLLVEAQDKYNDISKEKINLVNELNNDRNKLNDLISELTELKSNSINKEQEKLKLVEELKNLMAKYEQNKIKASEITQKFIDAQKTLLELKDNKKVEKTEVVTNKVDYKFTKNEEINSKNNYRHIKSYDKTNYPAKTYNKTLENNISHDNKQVLPKTGEDTSKLLFTTGAISLLSAIGLAKKYKNQVDK